MATVDPPPAGTELDLLTRWGGPDDAIRGRKAAVLSVLGHVVAIGLLALVPADVIEPERAAPARHVTPLIEPPTELTQKAPNKYKVSKELDAEVSAPRPRIQIPTGTPSTTRPRAFRQADLPPVPQVKATAPLPEAPKVDSAPPRTELPQITQTTPQIQPEERPKLALENPAAPPAPVPPGQSRIAIPNSSIAEAIRQATPGRTAGGLSVGDVDLAGPGGIGQGINLPPSPGLLGNQLELKSDPQGVDFRPYLLQVLAAVRRNWLAVIPDIVRLGRRGRVGIQFSISRSGGVPKLVIVSNSGIESLDRAAVAGISASNPFPPLPSEYKGDRIVVQLNFAYNMPRQ